MNNVCFSSMLILWERIFGCQGYFFLWFCLSKNHKSGRFPILSSRPIQRGNNTGVRCNLSCFVAEWQVMVNTWNVPKLTLTQLVKSVGILFMRLQRPEVIRRKSIQNLVYEGVMITFTGPIEHIFRDQVTAFSKPSQPAVGGSGTQVSPTFTEASCLCSCK